MHARALSTSPIAPPARSRTPAAMQNARAPVSSPPAPQTKVAQARAPTRASPAAITNAAPSLARSAGLKARAAIKAPTPTPTNNPTTAAAGPGSPSSIFGDVNGDGVFNAGDTQSLMEYLFMGGPEPAGMNNADVNGDGGVDISDIVSMFSMVTGQGPYISAGAVTPDITDTLTQ